MKHKKLLVITGLVVCITIIATVMIVATTRSPLARVIKQLDFGNKYLSEGNYEKAILAFERVIQIEPMNIEARMGLSKAYIKTGQFAKAEIRLKEVLEIDAEYIDAYIELANVIIELGNLEDAIKLLEEAYAKTGDAILIAKLNEIRPKEPVASIESGTYLQPFEVELINSQKGSEIYYTLDGTTPDKNATLYEKPIKIEAIRTSVKALCISENGILSDIVEYVYELEQSLPEQTVVTVSTTTQPQNIVYLENIEPSNSGVYTGNLGDSFIGRIGTRNGYQDINGISYKNGLEIWVARWNFEDEISWIWNEYTIAHGYKRLKGELSLLANSYNTQDFDTTIEILGDDKIIFSKRLLPRFEIAEIDIDISEVSTLKIYAYDNTAKSGGTSFLLADVHLIP